MLVYQASAATSYQRRWGYINMHHKVHRDHGEGTETTEYSYLILKNRGIRKVMIPIALDLKTNRFYRCKCKIPLSNNGLLFFYKQ